MTFEHSTWWCPCGKPMGINSRVSTLSKVVLECNADSAVHTPGCGYQHAFTNNTNLGIGLDGRLFPREEKEE